MEMGDSRSVLMAGQWAMFAEKTQLFKWSLHCLPQCQPVSSLILRAHLPVHCVPLYSDSTGEKSKSYSVRWWTRNVPLFQRTCWRHKWKASSVPMWWCLRLFGKNIFKEGPRKNVFPHSPLHPDKGSVIFTHFSECTLQDRLNAWKIQKRWPPHPSLVQNTATVNAGDGFSQTPKPKLQPDSLVLHIWCLMGRSWVSWLVRVRRAWRYKDCRDQEEAMLQRGEEASVLTLPVSAAEAAVWGLSSEEDSLGQMPFVAPQNQGPVLTSIGRTLTESEINHWLCQWPHFYLNFLIEYTFKVKYITESRVGFMERPC